MEISGILYSDTRTVYDPIYTPDVVFAKRKTGDLTMQVLTPVKPNLPRPQHHALYAKINKEAQKAGTLSAPQPETRTFPLIMCVPGSGWSGADGHDGVVHMVELAKQGFAVASISYRGTFKDDVRFPAAVQDAKEAIRYMRAHAKEFCIDAEHVALIGDSSGGHTVAMAALTGDDPKFNIGGNLDQPTSVNACVIYYGPNDLLNLVPDRIAEKKHLRPGEGEYPFEAREIFQEDFLTAPQRMLADASPINYITADRKMPHFLFLQGEEDPIIPITQGVRFCSKVRDCGGRAEFFKIVGGGHGTGCWTPEAMQLIIKFLNSSI